MKAGRLLALVVYLLNHGTVSARVLAERFEVSSRTIQRDMDTLALSGFPIAAEQGANGGYRIMSGFAMNRQLFAAKDYMLLITALRSMGSAYGGKQVADTFEKLMALSPREGKQNPPVQLDLTVLREGVEAGDSLVTIEEAITSKRCITFAYTNAADEQSHRRMEPLLLTCRWYAWYVFGFCRERLDYRLFRLSRIRKLTVDNTPFSQQHPEAEQLLAAERDTRPYLTVKLSARRELRVSLEERFPVARMTEDGKGGLIAEFTVPEQEKGWFGALLAYGNKVQVLEPDHLREAVIATAREIVEAYET
jgi:predicted DNA-binding transcriptional regulator YafY